MRHFKQRTNWTILFWQFNDSCNSITYKNPLYHTFSKLGENSDFGFQENVAPVHCYRYARGHLDENFRKRRFSEEWRGFPNLAPMDLSSRTSQKIMSTPENYRHSKTAIQRACAIMPNEMFWLFVHRSQQWINWNYGNIEHDRKKVIHLMWINLQFKCLLCVNKKLKLYLLKLYAHFEIRSL